jgi:phosphohistidine phosphatase
MKTLFVVRHAKSAWDDPRLTDKERTLNERGRHDAPKMARYVAKHHPHPNVLISSTATRAWSTAESFVEAFDLSKKHVIRTDAIYEAPLTALLGVVTTIDDVNDVAMLVGHNPGVTELVRYLSGESFTHMPTCGVVMLTFSHASSWQEIGKGTGTMKAFLYPKMFA